LSINRLKVPSKTFIGDLVAGLVMALFFTQWFYALLEAALGAIVIVAVSGIVKVAKLKHLERVRRADLVLAVVARIPSLVQCRPARNETGSQVIHKVWSGRGTVRKHPLCSLFPGLFPLSSGRVG
jgi:hypothetical protein